jgi:protein-S-isoprenylcysteine O-methyltransferase Ste14
MPLLNYAYLAPFYWLESETLQKLGIAVMSAALVLIIVAQQQMGNSWRIGVDYDYRTDFVQRGLFKYSRNPIFAGIMLSVIGYFMVLPNAIILLIVVLDLALIQVQIRLEEQHLASEYGEDYENYYRRVRRWI